MPLARTKRVWLLSAPRGRLPRRRTRALSRDIDARRRFCHRLQPASKRHLRAGYGRATDGLRTMHSRSSDCFQFRDGRKKSGPRRECARDARAVRPPVLVFCFYISRLGEVGQFGEGSLEFGPGGHAPVHRRWWRRRLYSHRPQSHPIRARLRRRRLHIELGRDLGATSASACHRSAASQIVAPGDGSGSASLTPTMPPCPAALSRRSRQDK